MNQSKYGTKPGKRISTQNAIDQLGFGRFHHRLVFLCAISWSIEPMEQFSLSTLNPTLACEWNLSHLAQAVLVTLTFVASMFGSLAYGCVGDKFGRNPQLAMSSSFTVYYGLLAALSPSYLWICLFKFCLNFNAASSVQAFTYSLEFTPTEMRSVVVLFVAIIRSFALAFQILVSYLSVTYLNWRWMLVISTAPCLGVAVCALVWAPESPRYSTLLDDKKELSRTITLMAVDNDEQIPKGTLAKLDLAPSSLGHTKHICGKEYSLTTSLLMVLWFLVYFIYFGVVLTTAHVWRVGNTCETSMRRLLRSGRAHPQSPCGLLCQLYTDGDYLRLLLMAFVEVPGQMAAISLMALWGRKVAIATFSLICATSCGLLALCMPNFVTLLFIFIVRTSAAGALVVLVAYTTEVFPTCARGTGVGMCAAVGNVAAALTPVAADILLHHSHYTVIATYAGVAVVSGLLTLCLPIETLNRPLVDLPLGE